MDNTNLFLCDQTSGKTHQEDGQMDRTKAAARRTKDDNSGDSDASSKE